MGKNEERISHGVCVGKKRFVCMGKVDRERRKEDLDPFSGCAQIFYAEAIFYFMFGSGVFL